MNILWFHLIWFKIDFLPLVFRREHSFSIALSSDQGKVHCQMFASHPAIQGTETFKNHSKIGGKSPTGLFIVEKKKATSKKMLLWNKYMNYGWQLFLPVVVLGHDSDLQLYAGEFLITDTSYKEKWQSNETGNVQFCCVFIFYTLPLMQKKNKKKPFP